MSYEDGVAAGRSQMARELREASAHEGYPCSDQSKCLAHIQILQADINPNPDMEKPQPWARMDPDAVAYRARFGL